MSSFLASYVPSSIVIVITNPSLNISHVVSGFAKDTMVSFEYPESAWANKSLSNGETVRTHNKDNTVRMTVSLDQTSASNDVLSALAKYDENDVTGRKGICVCTFADKSGRTELSSSEAFVTRPMSYSFGSDTTNRDWVFVLSTADQHVGGSALINPEVEATLQQLGYDVDDAWKTQ